MGQYWQGLVSLNSHNVWLDRQKKQLLGSVALSGNASNLFSIALSGLVFVAVFDPADRIFSLKIPLFLALWVICISRSLMSAERTLPNNLLLYVLVFSGLLPIFSMFVYGVSARNHDWHEAAAVFKSFLFLSLAIALYLEKSRPLRILVSVLTVESAVIILLAVIVSSNNGLVEPLYAFGIENEVYWLGKREYGGHEFLTIFLKTSPMLVISIAYFSYVVMVSAGRSRNLGIALLGINVLAMFLAGTRNNIAFSFLTPFLVVFWYARNKLKVALVVGVPFLLAMIYFSDAIVSMLDPRDVSNEIKLGYLGDYSRVLLDSSVVFFGQGIGSVFYSSSLGYDTHLVEPTYLEIVRWFGVPVAIAYFVMLALPLSILVSRSKRNFHHVGLAYLCYLVMAATNPFLFSSTGMLVLCIVLTCWFRPGGNV